MRRAFRDAGSDEGAAAMASELVSALVHATLPVLATKPVGRAAAGALPPKAPPSIAETVLHVLQTESARAFLAVHVHDGVAWFNKERFEALVHGLSAISPTEPPDTQDAVRAAAASGYRLEALIAKLRSKMAPSARRMTLVAWCRSVEPPPIANPTQ